MINKREILLGGLGLTFPQAVLAADSVRVPLEATEDGELNVRVSLNGQGPFTFRLDTGAGISSIPASLANRLKFQLIGDGLQPYAVTVGSQTFPAFRVNAAEARFGDELKLRNLVFMRVPTQAFGKSSFQGIIGSALTLSKPSILDLEKREIRFYPNGQLPLAGFRPVEAEVRRSGVNTVAVSIGCSIVGHKTLLGAKMTGGGGLYLQSSFVRKYKLWDAFPDYIEDHSDHANLQSGDWNKFHDFARPQMNPETPNWRLVKMKDFAIGPFFFDEVEVRLLNPDLEDRVEKLAGFVGGDIMSRFNVAFGQKNELWMKPNTGFSGHIA